jgi:serine/threonine protein kinase
MEGATGIVVGGCRLEQEIGRGGAGIVYRARQLGVNRAVAVKLIPVSDNRQEATERFEREAQAAGALDHPHCLPVYAAGEQDGLLYLVMRLVDGPDLAQMIRADGPLEPARAVALLGQVALAVDYAHRAGLVHRDLKPANILIEPDGRVGRAYVSDFGLMRSLADSPITLTGQWVGTPQFAAPEQQRGEPVGPAADIYALGRVLAQALGPQPPARLRPVLARAMHSDPAQRYPTAGALVAAARTAVGPPARRRTSRGPALRRAAALLLLGVIAAAVLVVVLALPSHHSTARLRTPPRPRANLFRAIGFTATLPAGWVSVVKDAQKSGYVASQVQSHHGATVVYIDRGTTTGQSLSAHEASVQSAAAAATQGYELISVKHTTLGGTEAIVWAFSGDDSQRVDVFRQVGQASFAVLAISQSLSDSQRAAMSIARSITLR